MFAPCYIKQKPPENSGGWSLETIERIACFIQYIQHTPTNGWIFT